MIRGPVEYTPPVEVEVLSRRRAVPLDENEGIYVRDIRNGKVLVVEMRIPLAVSFYIFIY